MRDRTTPLFSIRVNNHTIGQDMMAKVTSFEYEDTEHMDKVTITLDNRGRDLWSDLIPLGALLEVSYGYAGDMAKPRYCIANRATGWLTKTFTGYGIEQILNSEPKTRKWEDATLYDVLGTVVYEGMGLTYEHEERKNAAGGTVKYDYFQPNIPDLTFLYNLGRFIGFELWFEDGVVYFMPRRYWQKSYMEFKYEGPGGQVVSFEPDMEQAGRRGAFQAAGIDLEEKRQFSVTENGSTTRMYYLGGNLFDAEEALARYKAAERSYWILQPFTSKEAAEDTAAGSWVNAMEDQITAKLILRGEPHLKARRVITVSNVDEYSGKYYVKTVRHKHGSGGYSTEADLTRNALTDAGQMYSMPAARTLINKGAPSDPLTLLKETALTPTAPWVSQLLKATKA